MAGKKKVSEEETTIVYVVIEVHSDSEHGTHTTRAQARREAERLSREAYEGKHLHLGHVKEYEVRTRSGVIV